MGNCVYCPSETEIGTILKESFTVNLIEQVPPVGFSLPKTSFLKILSFLKTLEKSSEKCIDLFCSKLSSLVQHNFIAKQGWEKEVSKYPNKLKLEDISGYITTIYEGKWWLGYVLLKNEEFD
ncbi:hypothetical protein AVEN_137268-1 [Araneus ventricosus]|uniref:Uncharacterized protein n=1 Tax=Araneus ventricosus TaxID=182803 RepID=A0A4Y2DT55_ARAVE|nr:hypothetical protein AVEN_137268-1 [Araneus ventricosus]